MNHINAHPIHTYHINGSDSDMVGVAPKQVSVATKGSRCKWGLVCMRHSMGWWESKVLPKSYEPNPLLQVNAFQMVNTRAFLVCSGARPVAP